jgi:hypothetical protein
MMAVKTDKFRFEVELEVIHSEEEPTKQATAGGWMVRAVEQGLKKVQAQKNVPVTTALRGRVLTAWSVPDET